MTLSDIEIRRTTLLAMALVITVTVLFMVAFRSLIIPTSYGYLERNRWTGRMIACHVEQPFSYINSVLLSKKPSAIDPPRYCVDLKSEHFELTEQADQIKSRVQLVPMPDGFDPFAEKKKP